MDLGYNFVKSMWSGIGFSSLATAVPCLALLSFTGQVLGTENSPGHLHRLCPLLTYPFLRWLPSPKLFQIASMPTLRAPDPGLLNKSRNCVNLWDPWIIIHLPTGPWVPWDQRLVGICSLVCVPSSRKEPDKKEASILISNVGNEWQDGRRSNIWCHRFSKTVYF